MDWYGLANKSPGVGAGAWVISSLLVGRDGLYRERRRLDEVVRILVFLYIPATVQEAP